MSTDADVLAHLRREIDAVDAEIVGLLARRMRVVDRVIEAKRVYGLPALLPARVEEVVTRVRREAVARGVAPDLAETLWRSMIGWVVTYEDGALKPEAAAKS